MGLTTNTGIYGSTGSTPVVANTWYHFALVRSGNTLTFYRNGVAELTVAVSGAIPARTTQFGVGVAGEYTGVYGTEWGTRMMGWLDELRITKGVARYTAAFTPPTEPFAETATGSPGRPSGIDAKVQPRITRWTYNAQGQKLTEDGPRTDVEDVTRYEYYHDTTADHTLGDLKQVTDAAGNMTRYTKYNKHGQMLESVDANNAPTANTYDLRQRLKSTSVGGRTTTYDYDAAGQLKKLTLPDASWIGFDYDDAHRQIAVYDNKGNRTDYVLDNAGKRIAENTKDPGGALRRQLNRSIDALGRVQQTTGRE
jgi:YD repeat-containing protein